MSRESRKGPSRDGPDVSCSGGLADPVTIGTVTGAHGVRGTVRVRPAGAGEHLRKGLSPLVAGVRRAIATELRLFTSDLTVDLARLTTGYDWSTEDLDMSADLMVAAMLGTVVSLLEVDARHPSDADAILSHARRQLRLIALGMGAWRSKN